ncbi:acyltransferase [Paenibacillus glycanilyticus]|uniref:acyltransferase n=1 Tax=Paenibacillus glycanilyticus TaxID=126569 RepID=UPI001910CB4B|nr:acyltransferase [Paenibacillus glycanilyticus]
MSRILKKLMGWYIRNIVAYLFTKKYMPTYVEYLKKLGINFAGTPNYIDRSAYFDSNDYSLFHIGAKTVISREVMLLTHDYSIANGLRSINQDSTIPNGGGTSCFLKPIHIGNNSFIGARCSLLPGTYIGENCIIGTGSVVKGRIPDNSIVIGNPARVVGKTQEWAIKKVELNDFIYR